MKINQFRDPGLEEDYMDVHYREYNDEIRRILALTESGNTLWGKREGVQACLSPEEIYYFETVDRKCFACLKEEVYQVELGIQSAVERFGPLGFVRISKSAVVNVYKVRQLTADMNMRMQLLLDNGEKVVLNRGYKNEFLQFIKERRTQMGNRSNEFYFHVCSFPCGHLCFIPALQAGQISAASGDSGAISGDFGRHYAFPVDIRTFRCFRETCLPGYVFIFYNPLYHSGRDLLYVPFQRNQKSK